jgi:hypothetical protein
VNNTGRTTERRRKLSGAANQLKTLSVHCSLVL